MSPLTTYVPRHAAPGVRRSPTPELGGRGDDLELMPPEYVGLDAEDLGGLSAGDAVEGAGVIHGHEGTAACPGRNR